MGSHTTFKALTVEINICTTFQNLYFLNIFVDWWN